MKYLHEVVYSEDHYHENWEFRHKYLYMWTITKEVADKFDAIVPIKNIKNIQPYRAMHYFPNETLVITFNGPYKVYNGHVRITSTELVKLINRKKKYQNLTLKRKRRYFYAYLEGK